MASNSITKSRPSSSSPPHSSTESINGLKFGQKIYFEDVGLSAPAKSGVGLASSSSGATPSKKSRVGAVQGAPPPRCQVEGCKVDLSDAKSYYSKHKVCGMHSKSPKVIVAGLEQRFCQQCSRFHQLPEFDQGKRSCRRRLAGHNERRRKPPTSSLMTARCSQLTSSVFENNGRGCSFLMEFSAKPKLPPRNGIQTLKTSEEIPGNQATIFPWQGNLGTPSDLFLPGSAGRMNFPDSANPPVESFTGITSSNCALSLLSNQTLCPRSVAPSLGVNSLMNVDGMPMTQLATSHGLAVHQLPTTSWYFKGIDAGNCPDKVVPTLVQGQVSQPPNSQPAMELDMSQKARRQYMEELEQSRAYESSQQMQWPL